MTMNDPKTQQEAAHQMLSMALDLVPDPRDAIGVLGRAQVMLMAITRKEEVPLNQYVAAMCETWREDLLMAINAQEEVKRRRANG
jgi:hypothetical protein